MKPKSYFSLTGAFALTVATTLISSTPVRSQIPAFSCDTSGGVPSTVVQSPQHGTVKIIEWKTTEFGDEFSPEARCSAVSQKFEQYAKAGTLKYFTTGSVNRQPVICAVASQNAPCNSESMLYTLKKGTDASQTLKQLLDVRSGATASALNETESRIYIDFDKIVEAKAQANGSSTENNTEAESLF
jgi:hypothetical protein